MKSILEEFASGNISPGTGTLKEDSHYGRVLRTLCDKENELLSKLDAESKEIFEQYTEAQAEADTISSNGRFICGYRLGVLMTIEVFTGRDDAFCEDFY